MAEGVIIIFADAMPIGIVPAGGVVICRSGTTVVVGVVSAAAAAIGVIVVASGAAAVPFPSVRILRRRRQVRNDGSLRIVAASVVPAATFGPERDAPVRLMRRRNQRARHPTGRRMRSRHRRRRVDGAERGAAAGNEHGDGFVVVTSPRILFTSPFACHVVDPVQPSLGGHVPQDGHGGIVGQRHLDRRRRRGVLQNDLAGRPECRHHEAVVAPVGRRLSAPAAAAEKGRTDGRPVSEQAAFRPNGGVLSHKTGAWRHTQKKGHTAWRHARKKTNGTYEWAGRSLRVGRPNRIPPFAMAHWGSIEKYSQRRRATSLAAVAEAADALALCFARASSAGWLLQNPLEGDRLSASFSSSPSASSSSSWASSSQAPAKAVASTEGSFPVAAVVFVVFQPATTFFFFAALAAAPNAGATKITPPLTLSRDQSSSSLCVLFIIAFGSICLWCRYFSRITGSNSSRNS
jgi:hypothetical protein